MTDYFLTLFRALQTDRRGVTALEYAILAGVLCTAIVAALAAFTPSLTSAFTNLGTSLRTATTSG